MSEIHWSDSSFYAHSKQNSANRPSPIDCIWWHTMQNNREPFDSESFFLTVPERKYHGIFTWSFWMIKAQYDKWRNTHKSRSMVLMWLWFTVTDLWDPIRLNVLHFCSRLRESFFGWACSLLFMCFSDLIQVRHSLCEDKIFCVKFHYNLYFSLLLLATTYIHNILGKCVFKSNSLCRWVYNRIESLLSDKMLLTL